MCPHCKSKQFIKRGFFPRVYGKPQKIQRFLCRQCRRTFSTQSTAPDRRQYKSFVSPLVFRLLMSGVSQRRCARLVGIDRKTVARKFRKMAEQTRAENVIDKKISKATTVVFDELETFEHSKCKPVSIAIAVEEGSRRVIAARVAQMPAKGRLVKISLERYGYRKDCRPRALREVLSHVKDVCPQLQILKSDQSPRYPRRVREFLPGIEHLRFKGRRGCVVGQGELKAGGHDPLFSLNHTCAMFRDNIKRLTRRTWCTTKNIDRLQDLVDLYVRYHNQLIDGVMRPMTA
jgi:transposase-like protein